MSERERLMAEHRNLRAMVNDTKKALRAWEVEHANACGHYPIGTEVVWMRQAPGRRDTPLAGERWGTIHGYHFSGGSLVAEVRTSTALGYGYIDNDSACMAMPGYHYGTREEYRVMLERELKALTP